MKESRTIFFSQYLKKRVSFEITSFYKFKKIKSKRRKLGIRSKFKHGKKRKAGMWLCL